MKDKWDKLLQHMSNTRFDNEPKEVVYYANGRYYDKWFMIYSYDSVWNQITWTQSGYNSVEQLKQFNDFQERGYEFGCLPQSMDARVL